MEKTRFEFPGGEYQTQMQLKSADHITIHGTIAAEVRLATAG